VEHAIDVLHRPPHRAPVGDVTGRTLELELGEVVEARPPPGHEAKLVAAIGQGPRHVAADEP
jgi:hypothetical protein